jgi:hypothetical protein
VDAYQEARALAARARTNCPTSSAVLEPTSIIETCGPQLIGRGRFFDVFRADHWAAVSSLAAVA